jgi:Uncharacterized protein conserved in bacteria
MQAQSVDNPAPAMRMASVPDGRGGFTHQLVPVTAAPSTGKGKKKQHVPDPISANPDAAAQQLAQLIERIERLEEEKKSIGDDIKDVYLEGKATGFDPKIMKSIIALRKMNPSDRMEVEALLETYKTALGIA